MPKPPQDIYARHLLSPCGYPLWTPEPSNELLIRRPDGLRIGDVGVVIPEDGCFDVFFNVCLPADHPFHRPTGVPDNFKHIALDDVDIRTIVNAENPGRVLANSSVRSVSTVERSTDSSSRTRPSGTEYEFTLSSSEGALLILPEGAERRDLRNHHCFLELATQHGADWYRFVEERVGQIIGNDSLYLITGLHKTTSWSLAAFEKTAGTTEYPAQFRVAPSGGDCIAAVYTWDTTRALDWRAGPLSKYELANQAVFIRGFKVALRARMFGKRRISVRADSPSTKPNPARSFGAAPGGSWLACIFGGMSARLSTGIGPQDEVTVGSALDDAGNEIQGSGALAVGKHVVIHRVPGASEAFHPSDAINKYLLDKKPSANVAITHDDVWITILEENMLQPEDLALEGRLEAIVSQNFDIISEGGVVYLRSQSELDTSGADRPSESNVGGGIDHVHEDSVAVDIHVEPAKLQHTEPVDLFGSDLIQMPGDPPIIGASGTMMHTPARTRSIPRFKTPSTRRGPPPPYDSQPYNVIIFGETGVGKSSVINLIAGKGLAKTSPDANACTFTSDVYPVVLQAQRPFWIWDTVGLNEPQISHEDYLRAVKQAYKLIKELERSGGVHLLLLCMRGRITKSVQQNYRLFANVFCEKKVPLCVVVTNLENEPYMEEWWTANEEVFRKYGISADGHACITASPGVGDIFRDRYEESRERMRRLLLESELKLSSRGWKKDTRAWLTELLGKLAKMVPLQHRGSGQPTSQELMARLVNECGFPRREAIAIATSIGAICDQPSGSDEGPMTPQTR